MTGYIKMVNLGTVLHFPVFLFASKHKWKTYVDQTIYSAFSIFRLNTLCALFTHLFRRKLFVFKSLTGFWTPAMCLLHALFQFIMENHLLEFSRKTELCPPQRQIYLSVWETWASERREKLERSWAWWCLHVILALGRSQRQEDCCLLEACLFYITNPRPVRASDQYPEPINT